MTAFNRAGMTSIGDVLSDMRIKCRGCGRMFGLLDVRFKTSGTGTVLPCCPFCSEKVGVHKFRENSPENVRIKKAVLSLVNEVRGWGLQRSDGVLAMLPQIEVDRP